MHYIVLMKILDGITNTIEDALNCLFIARWVFFNVIEKGSIFSILKHNVGSLCLLIKFIIIDFYDIGMF